MFTSSRGATPERRGRRSSATKTALSSRISLFSGITTSSGRSSGSGSTITPEAASRSRRALGVSASLKQSKDQALPLAITRRQSTGSSATENRDTAINVFAFLEHDPSRPSTPDPDAGTHHVTQHLHKYPALPEDSDLECSARSFHSDSGISIRDSSPESLNWRAHSGPALYPLREEDSTYGLPRSPLTSHQHHPKMRPGRDTGTDGAYKPHLLDERCLDGAPEAFYRDTTCSSGLLGERPLQLGMEDSVSDSPGYDLLAARLTDAYEMDDPLRPLYRRFTRLNHRILLQLQDEIAQMEEDLAGLDAADVRFRRGSTGQIAPESRRSNWQWHGSVLHARRFDLLGQIYVKVEQYNQALASFQTVMKGTTPASSSDVQRYRSWMKKNTPIAEIEQRFLDEPDDLLTFCQHKSCPTCEGHASLAPGLIKTIVMGFTLVMALFTVFLFVISPRMGTILIVAMAVALYTSRAEVTGAVTHYLHL